MKDYLEMLAVAIGGCLFLFFVASCFVGSIIGLCWGVAAALKNLFA